MRWPFARGLPIRDRVIVNQMSGEVVSGILVGEYRDWLVLAHASLIGETQVAVDGEMYIPIVSVIFVQRPER